VPKMEVIDNGKASMLHLFMELFGGRS
jgi:hypothetical protein